MHKAGPFLTLPILIDNLYVCQIKVKEFLVVSIAIPVLAIFVFLFFLPFVIFAMTCLILWHIDIVVPPVTHEIDGSSTGVIFAAVFAPFLLMTRRYMHINWLVNNTGRYRSNHDWFCVNELWLRIVPDVNTTIKSGLADTDRHTNIGSMR